ncbi:MAG: DNA repair protein RecO [Holosporaceae bacterium]
MATAFSDDAFVLSKRFYGEKKVLLSLFTQTHGLQRGMTTCADHTHHRAFETGARFYVNATQKRDNALSTFSLEPLAPSPAAFLAYRKKESLLALLDLLLRLQNLLAANHPYPLLFKALCVLFDTTGKGRFDQAFVAFQFFLLETLGYGLELTHCAFTRTTENLLYLSTETGKAISEQGFATLSVPKKENLKPFLRPLPAFLRGAQIDCELVLPPCSPADLKKAQTLLDLLFAQHLPTAPFQQERQAS